MERHISGKLPSTSNHTSPSSSPVHLEEPKVSVKETSFDDDGVLKDEDMTINSNDRSKRKKELKSVLKQTGSTPVINVELEEDNMIVSPALESSSSSRSNNVRPKRQRSSPNGRECCNIL